MALERFKNIDIQIDHANGRISNLRQFAKSGDYNGRTLTVQLTNNGVIQSTAGVKVNLAWRNLSAQNTGLDPFTVLDASSGLYRLAYPKELLQPGKVIAAVQIIDGQSIVESRSFEITVEESAADQDAAVSSNSFTALDKALMSVDGAVSAANSAASGARDAKEKAEKATNQANQATTKTNQAAQNAMSAVSAATAATDRADQATRTANEAANGANRATVSANQAAADARAAAQASGDPLAKSGGTMTGNINMGGYRLLNVGTPLADGYAANKVYVDSSIKAIDVYSTAADGAGGHNSLYRGKNLGSSVTSTQWGNIKNGTFKDLFIGDYWQIDGVNWRIGAFDYYLRKGTLNTAHHHIVIVPDSIVKGGANKQMNSQGATVGGFMGSAMITTHIGQIRAQQPYTIFGYDHMMGFNVFLTNAVSNGRPSAGIWATMNISLLSELMLFGSHVLGASNGNGNPPLNHTVEHTQLPLFSMAPQYITEANAGQYWLQDIVSSASFATVEGNGRASYALANTGNIGVRPYFCIYQQ